MQHNNGVTKGDKTSIKSVFGLNPGNPESTDVSKRDKNNTKEEGKLLHNKRHRGEKGADQPMFHKPLDIYEPLSLNKARSAQQRREDIASLTSHPSKVSHHSKKSEVEVSEQGSEVEFTTHPTNETTFNGAFPDHPKLQNIVSTVNLRCVLKLREIALRARNAEYNPKRFAAVIMRIKEPKTTALIFASGKMVCTGARNEEESRKAAKLFAKIIKKLGHDDVVFSEFKIQNIVASCDVKFPIRLEGLAAGDNSKFSSYEPELFPGLIYRMLQPKVVLLVFVSGKIVLTGAKTREEIYKAYEAILPILKRYRKRPVELYAK